MSKYTTEVRFICESKSGLEVSGGSGDVDAIISKAWDKIFTSKAVFFDEVYRGVLCQKILKHYYLREIGCETVGIWVLWMNTRLEEIMPYYNQLYESAKIEFDPMHDVDLKRTHNRTGNEKSSGSRSSNGKQNSETSRNTSSNETKRDLFSDTPQGALTGIESETYLTNARKITDNVSGTDKVVGSGSDESSENTSGNVDTTEDYIENVVGKQGSESFSVLLNKYRETFLNIDMQVIEEFEDLFFGLW